MRRGIAGERLRKITQRCGRLACERLGWARQLQLLQVIGVTGQISNDSRLIRPGVARRFRQRRSHLRFFHLFGRSQYFLRAKSQSIHLAGFPWAAFPFFKCDIDAAQRRFERDAGVLPYLHQRPVQRRQDQHRAPAALEMLLDFREVIEVVFHSWNAAQLRLRVTTCGTTEGAELLLPAAASPRCLPCGWLRS